MENTERAYLCRRRAEELRAIAANFHDVTTRRDLLTLAEQWDAMAERLEMRPPPDALPASHPRSVRKVGG
jgi:hypothetical protein